MMDKFDRQKRREIMSKVPSKNTKPEIKLRKALHAIGMRYKLHCSDMPGRPDMTFPKYKAVVLLHGCFWHRHGCKKTTTPVSKTL